MKKLLLIALLLCSVGTFAACGNEGSKSENENSRTTNSEEEEDEETSEREIDEERDEEEEQEEAEDVNGEAAELPQVLSLCQTYASRYEWQDDIWLVYSEYSNIAMWDDAEQYSEMDGVLSEIEGMQTRTMEDEADNMLSFAQEMVGTNAEGFETQVSTLDVQIRRADSVAVSFLTDSYADYGFIQDFRGMWGSNYDAQTGEELLLSLIRERSHVRMHSTLATKHI